MTSITCIPPFPRPLDLTNKSILITGGATGLGLAAARSLASTGGYITIATNAPMASNMLSSLGERVQQVICDVSDWSSISDAFKRALAFSPTGTLDIVIMFAGVDRGIAHLVDDVAAVDPDAEPKEPAVQELEVNLKGTLYTTSLSLHYFRRQPSSSQPSDTATTTATTALQHPPRSLDKSLTFISSLAGYVDDTHSSVYTTSKFGTRGLFRAIREKAAATVEPRGVRCNLIAPWAVRTPMTDPILAAMEKMGIKEGSGITLAREETVVEAVERCVGDVGLSGE